MKNYDCIINGIKLGVYTNTCFKTFCIGVIVRAGSMFESNNYNGISHLLEHVIFRNLKEQYKENFYELLALNGIDIDACTYKEFLYLSISGPSYSFGFGSELLSKIFGNIEISSDAFNREKNRIKAEIREKDEKHSLDYSYNKAVWKGTCIENSILGNYSTINRISLKKLDEFRSEVFSKNNIYVVLTGNIGEDDIEKIKNKLNDFNINQAEKIFENKAKNTEGFFNRSTDIIVKQDYWHYVKIGFDVETAKYKGGVHDLIYAVLFKGDKALFYRFLSEDNPLIYSYDPVYEQYNDVSNISVRFEVSDECLHEAFENIVKTLKKLKSGEFNFEANLQSELASWRKTADNIDNLNWNIGYYNYVLETEPLDLSDEKFGRLKCIDKDQIVEAANEIFKTSNMTVAIKGNKRKINIQQINEILSKLDK